jgi:hypothetical protein
MHRRGVDLVLQCTDTNALRVRKSHSRSEAQRQISIGSLPERPTILEKSRCHRTPFNGTNTVKCQRDTFIAARIEELVVGIELHRALHRHARP